MAFALEGAHFKIIWAHQRLGELERHITLYFEHTPHTFPAYRQGDLVIVEAPRLYAPPHLDIGGIIGDCLCAMMASLDYIVWELASKHAGRTLVPPPLGTDKPSFPIYSDPQAYRKRNWAASVAKYNIPATVLTEIADVQPYNAGYEPLGLLYLLVNQDKHRWPLLMEGHIKSGDLRITVGGEPATVVASTLSSVAVQSPVPISQPLRQRKLQVDADIVAKFVAFGDPLMPREPVQETLSRILVCVQSIHASFVKFFV